MTTDWRALAWAIEPKAKMTAPATQEQIAIVEQAVGATFPADLRALYLQTNGIQDEGYGPILPLSGKPVGPFKDNQGQAPATGAFLADGYSVLEYTALQRSMWLDDAGVEHPTFVVIGVDIGGNPFGFFADAVDDPIYIRSIAHDDGSVNDEAFSLEKYIRYYFAECAWFPRKP